MLNNFTGSEVFGTSLLNDFVTKLNQEFSLHMKINGTEYNALVSSINTKNSSQDTEITNIKTAATALTSRVGTAETNINTLSTNLTNLTSSHNGLNSTVGGISTSLGNVQSKITTLENEVLNVKTRVGNLETNVGLLQGQLGDVNALIQQKVSEANQSTMGYIDALREEKTDVGHQHAWTDLINGIPATATRWPTWAEVTDKPTTISGYGITDALGIIISTDTNPDALVLKGVYSIADTDKSFVTVNSTRVTGTETTSVTQTKVPTEGISKPCWRKGTGNPIVWGNWEFLGGFDGKGKADILYNEALNSIDFKIISN